MLMHIERITTITTRIHHNNRKYIPSLSRLTLKPFYNLLLCIIFCNTCFKKCDAFHKTTVLWNDKRNHINIGYETRRNQNSIIHPISSCSKISNSMMRNLNAVSSVSSNNGICFKLLNKISLAASQGLGSQYLVRSLFLRGLGLVYLTAFLVALHQNKALIGDNGITPARKYLDYAEKRARIKDKRRKEWLEKYRNNKDTTNGSIINKALKRLRYCLDKSNLISRFIYMWNHQDSMGRVLITPFYFVKNRDRLNPWLDAISIAGISLSLLLLLFGKANLILLFFLWFFQRSLMSVGGPWYGYGWEPQLAELTFHSFLLVPLLSLSSSSTFQASPIIAFYIRCFLFRIMIGAGLIKLKSGDYKWKYPDFSAMNYFYETQPVPNPLSKKFHFMPRKWHIVELLSNHFIELVVPFGMILPGVGRNVRIYVGLLQIFFQMILVTSGNLSFLNWLTMLPALFCLDDAFLSKYLPFLGSNNILPVSSQASSFSISHTGLTYAFAILVSILSIPVAKNLMAKKQLMNASFEPLRLINTYGAFGVVNEERIELIIESACDINGPWKEYQFKVKPGDIFTKPRFISPYHYRLDWQMWIASNFYSIERSPWMYRFLLLLLQQDEAVIGLLKKDVGDPWMKNKSYEDGQEKDEVQEKGEEKPKYIRVDKYRYTFCNTTKNNDKSYWKRERIGKFFPQQSIAYEELLKDLAS